MKHFIAASNTVPTVAETVAIATDTSRSNTPPPQHPVVIVNSGASKELDEKYPRDVSNGHPRPKLNAKGIVLGPSVQSVTNLSFFADKFKAKWTFKVFVLYYFVCIFINEKDLFQSDFS